MPRTLFVPDPFAIRSVHAYPGYAALLINPHPCASSRLCSFKVNSRSPASIADTQTSAHSCAPPDRAASVFFKLAERTREFYCVRNS